jgi:hypothetical protein
MIKPFDLEAECAELLEIVLVKLRTSVLLLYTEDKSLVYIPISRLFKVYKDNEMVYSGFDWIKAVKKYWELG